MTKRLKLTILAIFCGLLFVNCDIYACTSAIISGRMTPDGRPILWKHRDTGAEQNLVRYFKGEKYSFVAIAPTQSKNPKSVWIGVNDAGFAIMNTLSYNIARDSSEVGGHNGVIMKKALESCATVEEFEQMLLSMPKPWRVNTNYGMIDAKGNAFYFEINNNEYFKYDVNDPKVAPLGYIVRSNFSNAGNTTTGKGYIRFMQADHTVKEAVLHNNVTPDFIFENLSRSFVNPLMGIDLKSGDFNKPKTNGWFVEQDIITRYKSTCSVVIQGIKEGESPDFSTMWTIVGYPPTTPAIPVWVKGGEEGVSPLLRSNKDGLSTIANKGYILKESVYCYRVEAESAQRYFNWEMLFNLEGTGYMQIVEDIEKETLKPYKRALERWRKEGKIDVKELKQINEQTSEYILKRYAEELHI